MSGSPDQRAARRLFATDPLGDRWAASGLVLVDVNGARPQVSIAAGNRGRYAQLWLDPEEAGKVADLLDLLTYATPTQMQRLVRGIQDAIETGATTEVPERKVTLRGLGRAPYRDFSFRCYIHKGDTRWGSWTLASTGGAATSPSK